MKQEVLAGISVAGLLLPSAIAYAAIAGLSPDHAIVATIVGLGIYALLGRSRFAMVAPTSSSAAILAALIISMQRQVPQGALVADAAILGAGLCFLVAGALRAGALASFISRPVLSGFSFGIALTITIKQIPAIAGVTLPPNGDSGILPLIWHLTEALPQFHIASVALGVSALLSLAVLRRWRGFPASALVLAAGVLLSALVDLPAYHVGLVGAIAIAMPGLSWPALSLDDWSRIIELSVPLFLILFAESWGSIRGLALLHGDKVVANRELVALGFANAVAGLLHGMPVGAGFSASSAAESAGARTRYAGLAAMIVLIILSLWGRSLVALVPAPVLASVVIASLFHVLNPGPVLRLWHIRRDEIVATAAALAVIGFGVLDGMMIAVGLSLLALLQRFSAARIARLGRIPGTHDFVDLARNQKTETDPRILMVRPMEPLFFANAERVLAVVADLAEADSAIRVVILSLEESPDFDSTAMDALLECQVRLAKTGRTLLLARVKDDLRDLFRVAGPHWLASDDCCFWSVSDAFKAALKRP
ncbi:SulP family inorganic anion transporter [Sodalis sp. RH15]|uniref:SulP family inorganic anion transporter n=1 Tax=Sodalis sp. RH15 TaxID=3394330 RepID=UPI0039B69F15